MTHYSPKQVADRLGVSESSVKRWLDQGTVPFRRTAGGHRRVSEVSLQQLVEQLKASSGMPSISGIDEEVVGSGASAERAGQQGERSVQRIGDAFTASLAQGNFVRCNKLLNELIASGYSPAIAADLLITPAMHGIGHHWEHGQVAIYQERRACAIAVELIRGLARRCSVRAGAPTAIGGAPERDQYQVATALVELALRQCGWRATSLGSNLPLREFLRAVGEYRPRLVWVSVSYLVDEEAFVRDFNELAASLPKQTALLLGGRAATDQLRPRLRYTSFCDSLSNLVDLADSLFPSG